MGRDLLKNRSGLWWLLLALLGATAAAVIAWVLQGRLARELRPSAPIQIESDPWYVGTDVELTLRSAVPHAGQVISVTVLAPGSNSPQIEGIAPDFFGLSGVQIPWLLPEYRGAEMALAAASGARYIGLDFDWRRLEPQRGQYAWEDTDAVVALAKQHELRLVPMLLYTPHWASIAPFAPLDYQHAPPADYADYRDFVYAVVDRYKPHGASPLTVDGYGITDWVIWNEPNLRSVGMEPEPNGSWNGSLEEYLLLLRAGYEGAHAADPDCNVLNGGLADIFWAEGGLYLPTALERVYDPDGDGDASDGARPFFDTLNIHTYQVDTPEATWYEDRLEALVKVMERFGDGEKPIWVTEAGYGSVTAPTAGSPFLGEETQADAVTLIYRALSAYPQVERVFWWSLRDYYANASAEGEAMEAHYGLVRANFTPKPAYLAYGRLAGRVGQVLTLNGLTDEEGIALVSVPATFVGQPGAYVLFAQLEGVEPATVVMYQALTDEGE
jgi:GH35 family endo-1,4-beta-xylanase